MKNIISILALCGVLAGCAAVQQQVAKANVEKRIAAECPAKKKGNMAKRDTCSRDIIISEIPNDPGLPILMESFKQSIKWSELYDSGKITKTKYETETSDIKANYEAQIGALNGQYSQQRWQAVGNALKNYGQTRYAPGVGQVQPTYQAPTYQQPKPVQTHCTVTPGNATYREQQVNCTSN